MSRSRDPLKTGKNDLIFLPLGGAGEIGMNLNLLGHAGKWLMLDLGVTFGDDQTPGVDVIMPDPQFIAGCSDDLVALVLTHAHEDHIGAVPYLWSRLKCPIYATPFTASVVRRKLKEVGLEDKARVTEVEPSSKFRIGPFAIELITLTHSIPEPNAVVIRTAAGTVLHTGDWKFDPDPLVGPVSDEAALKRVGEEGVLALIGDSTNVFREGTSGSEAEVRESLIELVGGLKNRVAVGCFASNVARLETIAAVAEATGRQAALVGRSLWRIYDAARENGYLTEIPRFLTDEEIAYLPRDKVLIAATGSQGEPNAALTKIAYGTHPHVVLEEGDTVVFSSRIIPGNEKPIGRLHNAFFRLGVKVISEKDHFVHVSGHPARDELIRMYQFTRPRIAVPVHGEARHLGAHAELAANCQVPEQIEVLNGEAVRLAPGRAEIVAQVPAGRLALDGEVLVPIDGPTLQARKRLMWNGMAVVTVVVDATGSMVAPPQIALQGIADDPMVEDLRGALSEAIEDALADMPRARKADDEEVGEATRRAVRRALRELRGKRPPTEVHVVRVT